MRRRRRKPEPVILWPSMGDAQLTLAALWAAQPLLVDRLAHVEERVNHMTQLLTVVGLRLDNQNELIDRLDDRLSSLEEKVGEL